MKVAVISDTHIPVSCEKLPDVLVEQIKAADLIIHAGDLIHLHVLEELKKLAPTEAVAGNMDSHKVKRKLPEKRILKLGKFRIGIIHGWGPADDVINYVKGRLGGEKLDCIIYGHTHRPAIDTIDKTIYFNPGSPTEKIFAPYNAFGILEIGEELKPEIIRL